MLLPASLLGIIATTTYQSSIGVELRGTPHLTGNVVAKSLY